MRPIKPIPDNAVSLRLYTDNKPVASRHRRVYIESRIKRAAKVELGDTRYYFQRDQPEDTYLLDRVIHATRHLLKHRSNYAGICGRRPF